MKGTQKKKQAKNDELARYFMQVLRVSDEPWTEGIFYI